MTDLHDRFRALDDLRAPDLWHEIEGKAFAVHPAGVRPFPWVLAMVVVLLALAIGSQALIGTGFVKLPVVPNAHPSLSATAVANDAAAWIATGSMVTPRSGGHTVTLLADGTVLVAGGATGGGSAASAELLNPATLTWTSTGDMIQGRWGHTATLLPDGRVLIAGGGDPNGNGRRFRSAELYDPATGIWTASGDMAETRTGHTATLLPDGTVLVAGGHNGGPFLDSAELYDPATGIWIPGADMTHGRASHTATLLSDETVLVAGGVYGNDAGPCCEPLSSAELFDPRTGSWTATGSMIELRGGSTATLLTDGQVFVVGAINMGNVPAAELYDPDTRSWTPARNMIEPRHGLTATLLRDGRVLVAGGGQDVTGDNLFPIGFTGLGTAELYDPSLGSWTATRTMNATGRGGGQVAIALTDGRVLVVGGVVVGAGERGEPDVLSEPAAEIFDPDGGD